MTHSPVGPASRPDRPRSPVLPTTPSRRMIEPLAHFLELQSASGIVLIVCTLVALALANSPWASAWDHFWHTEARISLGTWELQASLAHWVNDGLMTIFFFLVGLEIKRELAAGELRTPQKAALPIFAALGGMVVPAAIYLLREAGSEGSRGWGIPMATDIAFAVGVLALLGRRVPVGLKIFLLALAIADDIGAILIIALFYSGKISAIALGLAAFGIVCVQVLNRIGVRSVPVYVLVGIGVWLGMFHSGIHPTVAGVVLGLMTPVRPWIAGGALTEMLLDAVDRLDGKLDRPSHDHEHSRLVGTLTVAVRESASPLERLEAALHPWVAFVIMPIFALANAGVPLNPAAAGHSVAWSVAAGLVLGKPLGIVLFSWLAVQVGIARLPAGVHWLALLGAGCLGGIGFTMSLFIAGLALEGTLLDAAKIGTLTGSTVSAIAGLTLLITFLPRVAGPAEKSPPGGEHAV
ncbi:MAG: Na+/H+ antiporter NhaA [Pirellulaceae bacterium]|nr:Na+/H+ antiporter NhaA [Pirellulaceae bacterium]